MRRVLSSILVILALMIAFMSMPSFAEEERGVVIKDGFLKGSDFLALSRVEQSKYAMGLVDGMLLAPFFGAPKTKLAWLENCLVGMTDKQVVAMLRKELESNPGEWHYSAHRAMYRAMIDACPGSGKKTSK